ncbi:MAG: GGDEF domain-containing protein [Gammaproteobacteria bacterium]|nr:GGDEF domain-containing protein [Gammaproteobacteria bacterium]
MKAFLWDKHFVTGMVDVDDQHKILIDLINDFGGLISTGETIQKTEIDSILNKLAEYAKYHFQTEEIMMHKAKVDQRHLTQHCNAHQQFINDISMMYSQLSMDRPASATSLMEYLVYWLAYHILGTDQSLAKQISLIEDSMDPADAYNAIELDKESATEPLLIALNGLFRQVSERNRDLTLLNQTLERRVEERTEELVAANIHLEQMAMTDQLTKLPNRRHAMQSLAKAWEFSYAHDVPLSLIMIDADDFKEINDNHGHDAGDQVLRSLSNQLMNSFRTDDIVCRMGGDEFMVICHNTPLDGALYVAELARRSVAEMQVSVGDGYWQGSISLGVATRNQHTATIESLIKAADNAVYTAKRQGRNQVCSE